MDSAGAKKRTRRRKVKNPLVARAIRTARAALRLTCEEVGTLVGVNARAVGRWEMGRSEPPKRTRALLVRAIEAQDARVARPLAVALGQEGLLQPPPPEPSAAALRDAVMLAADELDVAPGRVRRALAAFLRQLEAGHHDLATARAELAAWMEREAGTRVGEPRGPVADHAPRG